MEPPALTNELAVIVDVDVMAFCFALRASCVALEIGLFASAVLSTLPSPTLELVVPLTVPVKVGLANGAFDANWCCTVV